jgi:hypothetical protein
LSVAAPVRYGLELHQPEANSFPSEFQQFCNIGAAFHRIARLPRWRVGPTVKYRRDGATEEGQV